ncbi:MAG: hypothetical protein C0420_13285 [Methylobacterium sp.]|nr:hypothetical protein [Methylobacterium sp.]
MLIIDDLTVRYRTAGGEIEALSSVSLQARRGSTLALVGESGSGKSTIALAAMGLLPAEASVPSGRILFDGADILTMGAEARRQLRGSRIGLVFQDPFSVLNPACGSATRSAKASCTTAASHRRPPSSGPSRCSTRSASSTPRPSRRPIRTSSRAACASAR